MTAIRILSRILRNHHVPSGIAAQAGNEVVIHWRFSDQARDWRITLTPEFITLETRAYKSRDDFLERFEGILQALEDTLAPKLVTRFGMRYIDQIRGGQVSEIGKLLPDRGTRCRGLSKGATARQLITELFVPADPGDLLARWGKLPANVTIDSESPSSDTGGVVAAGSGCLKNAEVAISTRRT